MSFWNGIDTIVVMEDGKRAQALCNIPNTLDVFNTHFPRFPVLPGVWILESISQLATSLLAGTGMPWRLQKADQIRFRHFVQPGSQMQIEVEIKHLEDTTALLSSVVKVDQRVMTTVRQLVFVTGIEAGEVQEGRDQTGASPFRTQPLQRVPTEESI